MFINIEIQADGVNNAATIVTPYTDRNTAESGYHQILMAAATSSIPIHSAVMLDEFGNYLRKESYDHREPDDAE